MDCTNVLRLALDVRVERQGNRVKILLPRTADEEETRSLDLAPELADLIEPILHVSAPSSDRRMSHNLILATS